MSNTGIEIHFPVFAVDGGAQHGGVKRSRQLCSIASAKNRRILTPPSSHRAALRHMLLHPWSACSVLFYALPMFGRIISLRGLIIAVLYGSWLHRQMHLHKPDEVHIETGPNLPILLGNLLVSFGTKTRAYPHNLEFMVPWQSQSYFVSPNGARLAEMRIYEHSRSVFTISRFDAAVLKCLGVETAEILPYEPVLKDMDSLQKIRVARAGSKKDGILILGSVSNPPTRKGVLRLLEILHNTHQKANFILAGNATEHLVSRAPPNVLVRGTVSDEELTDLLKSCEAMLVYQPQTSGMLTRLVDATIADVPVYVLGGYLQALEFKAEQVVPIDHISQLPFTTNESHSEKQVDDNNAEIIENLSRFTSIGLIG